MARGQVGIRLQGDWRKLRHKFDRTTYAGEHFAEVTMQNLAETVKLGMQLVIGNSPAPNNAKQTIYNKGFDRPMVETFNILQDDSIVILTDKSKWETIFSVQGSPTKKHPRSKLSYAEIIQYNSEGTGEIPARKLIPIAYSLTSEDIKQYARKSLNEWLEG